MAAVANQAERPDKTGQAQADQAQAGQADQAQAGQAERAGPEQAGNARQAMSFGSVAEDYDRLRPPPPAAAIDWLVPARCEVAVDLAAGTGLLTRALGRRVPRVIAVEPDERMAAVLRSRSPEVEVLQGTGEVIPLPDASADGLFISSAWHWLDPVRATAEIARVLRDGGRFGVLWTSRDNSAAWLQDLRSQGAPEYRTDPAEHLPQRPHRQVDLPESSAFTSIQTETFPFTLTMAADDVIELLSTYSSSLTASPQERSDQLRRAAITLEERFPGAAEIEVPLQAWCWRADRIPRDPRYTPVFTASAAAAQQHAASPAQEQPASAAPGAGDPDRAVSAAPGAGGPDRVEPAPAPTEPGGKPRAEEPGGKPRAEEPGGKPGAGEPGWLGQARAQFSSLSGEFVFLDAPGGTQTPDSVGAAAARVYREASGNLDAPYATSKRLGSLTGDARAGAAEFLGCDAEEIIFGASMTALNYTLTRTLGRQLRSGDEIIVTRLDHDANVAPWLDLASDLGLSVRVADVHADTTLDLASLESQLGPRTRVVAFPWAANTVGTVVDARAVCELAHRAGALAWVDAVQYAPHAPVDVREIGADVLLCSAYKFCGPHLGIAFGRRDLLESWRPYKARPAPMQPVGRRFETGTLPYELLAGLLAALDYNRSLGGWDQVIAWEHQLGERLLAGLPSGARLHGMPTMAGRVPTFLVSFPGMPSAAISVRLAELGFGVWSGRDYYAPGLYERIAWGDAVRIGLAHYNTLSEIDRFCEVLASIVSG